MMAAVSVVRDRSDLTHFLLYREKTVIKSVKARYLFISLRASTSIYIDIKTAYYLHII